MILSRCVAEYEKLLERSAVLRSLEGFHYAICGGAIRSWYLEETPRDIDIAVDDHIDDVREWADGLNDETISIARNRFGGWKLREKPEDGSAELVFDVWPLNETEGLKSAYKELSFQAPHTFKDPYQFFTFENLAQYAPWNVDCMNLEVKAVETKSGYSRMIRYNDRGLTKAIVDNKLDMNYEPTSNHPMKALRGLRVATKGFGRGSLKLTSTARHYLATHLGKFVGGFGCDLEQLGKPLLQMGQAYEEGGEKHYGAGLIYWIVDRVVVDWECPLLGIKSGRESKI